MEIPATCQIINDEKSQFEKIYEAQKSNKKQSTMKLKKPVKISTM